jgi:septal ring-binding cell division protein DamX
MAHEIVTWRLHKKGVILAVLALLLFTILVFAAGYMTAVMRLASMPPKPATAAKAAAPKAKAATTTQASAVAPGATSAAAPPAPQQTLALQVAIFASEEEATTYVKELAKMELTGFVVAMPTRDGPVLYGVEAGEYKSRRDALAAADVLQHKHGIRATVVPASRREIMSAPAP